MNSEHPRDDAVITTRINLLRQRRQAAGMLERAKLALQHEQTQYQRDHCEYSRIKAIHEIAQSTYSKTSQWTAEQLSTQVDAEAYMVGYEMLDWYRGI